MTKEKIRYVVKRYNLVKDMICKNVFEQVLVVNNRKEKIIIDNSVIAVINVIDDIIKNEQRLWMKKIIEDILNGKKDIAIFVNYPIERTKYYDIKRDFINKIYICCVYKGLVTYEDILKEEIG